VIEVDSTFSLSSEDSASHGILPRMVIHLPFISVAAFIHQWTTNHARLLCFFAATTCYFQKRIGLKKSCCTSAGSASLRSPPRPRRFTRQISNSKHSESFERPLARPRQAFLELGQRSTLVFWMFYRAAVMVNPDVILDPTLFRTRKVKCPQCQHSEAVYFIPSLEHMQLNFVCCNPDCTHHWVAQKV